MLLKSSLESIQKLSTKNQAEYFDGEKELVPAGNPSLMIGGKPSSRDHAMHMGMMQESLSPSVQNSEKSDLGAEVLGIGGDLEEGLGHGPKK